MATVCIHCYVSGRVQGVWYRATTKKMAKKFGVNGWVKNLPDGRVEVMICGDAETANALKDWLWEGPIAAEVKDIVVIEEQCQSFSAFEVL